MAKLIETINLTKIFKKDKGIIQVLKNPFSKETVTALNKVNLEVEQGEIVGVLGPNGAGKTTLMKVLSCLLIPDEGQAFINGWDVAKNEGQVKKLVGLVNTQERSFYWRLTGKENLAFFGKLYNLNGKTLKEKVDSVLETVGLSDWSDYRFDSYSSGMKKRMSIARCLLSEAPILLMDEPTAAVDPLGKIKIQEFIKNRLVGELNKTIVLATQDLLEAQKLCDRIYILSKGEIKASGSLKELQSKIGFESIHLKLASNKNHERELSALNGVVSLKKFNGLLSLQVNDSEKVLPEIIELLNKKKEKILHCNVIQPSLDEIFGNAVGE